MTNFWPAEFFQWLVIISFPSSSYTTFTSSPKSKLQLLSQLPLSVIVGVGL